MIHSAQLDSMTIKQQESYHFRTDDNTF